MAHQQAALEVAAEPGLEEGAPERAQVREGQEGGLEVAWAAVHREAVPEVAHPAAKVPTLARNREQGSSNVEQAQGLPEVEGHEGEVQAAWAQVAQVDWGRAARSDRTTQEAAL